MVGGATNILRELRKFRRCGSSYVAGVFLVIGTSWVSAHEDLVSAADGRAKTTEDSVLMKVRMNADTDLILRDFKTLLYRLQTHNEYQSKARFQSSHSQQQIKLEKLAEALNA